MKSTPWDQRAARVLVRPLVRTAIRPNHITFFSLVLALLGAWLIAIGIPSYMNWGAGLFVLARFLDHFDGELARQQGTLSRLGYYFDYFVGGVAHLALFVAMGFAFRNSMLGDWSLVLGFLGALSALISMVANVKIDKLMFDEDSGDAVGYPGMLGFELEDGIYLVAPITWLGWLLPFVVASGIGATVYCLWTLYSLFRLSRN